ncbi:hypothetical protein COY87_02305 [Candidatus Roizmanbacteria bacterium CG_4_10_14_0_8_um_filter_33_9]|uniref:Glycosyltransferase 2-like domain-containing protein n=1 Tax=Candidatus Roizmanbacteria bacterium CG_4_10_14_0_8_um_filter_33_9 TaxID=1974826 RepID=A0A2M7QJM5_9BACT|nr:MAG: hypothetical protein COY87_02305 [Candidatus Roizmanbacteria bacterium CG_4_10_14_0_8_um_filter_33_9]
MKISVVIPVYNEEKYIIPCIKSLLNQTLPADEIIVVDNNCQDNTITLCKQFSQITIIQEHIQGMIPTRNKGFNTAKGDVIARCDADAILPNNWISEIKKQFSTHTIDALTGPIAFYDLYLKNTLASETYSTLFKPILKGNDILIGPNMILTKQIWNKVKKRVCLDDTKVHEDIDLTLHIIEYGGKIKRDKKLVVKISGRRIKHNPASFFGEYPIRFIRTLLAHKEYLSIPFLES